MSVYGPVLGTHFRIKFIFQKVWEVFVDLRKNEKCKNDRVRIVQFFEIRVTNQNSKIENHVIRLEQLEVFHKQQSKQLEKVYRPT